MHFLNQLFNRYTNPDRRRVKRLLKNLLLESLEQRIALDASGSPTLDALSDVTIDENAPEQTVNLTGITSGGTDVQWLKITAASDNTGLIPNPSVTPSPMTQPPATGVLSFTPVADQFGTAMITVTAENGGPDNNLETPGNNATLTQTFTVFVTQAGAPTLDPLSDLTIDENAPEQTVYLTGITSGGNPDAQQLKITAASDNTGLIPNPTVTPSSMSQPPDPTGILSFTPEADQFGTAVITVTAENGGPDNNLATPGNNATLTQTFTVVVTEASNEPDPDAPEVRPQLERVREVHIDNSLAGPDPMVFGKSELVGYDTKSFVITHVAAGSTVEKWDAATNQWRDVSTPPTSSNPRQLLQLLRNRIIQEDDQIRWIPKSTAGVTQKAFEILGWDDGSEASEQEGVNVPGAVENLEIDIVGDQVQVTWDAPTTGAAVTNYRIHQNPTTVVPSTQTSLTFAKVASPASYAVTVQANSAEGAGEAMTVTLSTGSYVKNDGTVVDPILDTSGNVLDYDGPKLKADANLTGAFLNIADLTGADLTGVDLNGADLTGAFLYIADLTGADLTGANLTGAFLNIADLTGADLTGADLTGVDLNGADLTNANLTNANLTNAKLDFADLTGANLSGANLTSADLTVAHLTDANLLNADLTGANLTNADLSGADLSDADLNNADLTDAFLGDADLDGVSSGGIIGTPSHLPTDWQLIDGYLIGPGADLTGADLTGADLTGAFLKGADLTNTNLAGADLSGADLSDADLNNADLTDANLTNANLIALLNNATLTGANLTNANLGDADLTGAFLTDADLTDAFLAGALLTNTNLAGADLSGADLTGANLTGANLFGVQSGGITGTPHALPTAGPYGNVQWQLIDGYLIGPGADLTGASLTDSNLNNTSLVGANLTNAQLNGAHLDNADLYNATLSGVQSGAITGTILFLPADWRLTTNGYLIGPSANLTNADLSNADLNNVDLSNATLTGVRSGGITGVPHALPANWQLTDGYLIGPGADLRDADLNSADLTGANLTGADLTGAILGNGNLTGANLTGADLTGAILNTANLTGADLSGANLTGASLNGANLTGADLNGADLTNADLTYVDLNGADLSGADLSGANLTIVKSGGITVTGTPPTLPADWQLIDGYLIGPHVNLNGADLSGANLSGANLTGASLSGANLTDANLTGANLTGADLTDADLTNVKSGGITVTGTPPTLPTDWQLIDGYLIGPTADLTGANLLNANLTGANLLNADLTSANLYGADLTDANLYGADLADAFLTDANLTDAFLTDANLTDANLTDAYLTDANLTDANLADANLTDANLTDANLTDATLTGADLTGANLTGAFLNIADLTGADLTGADLTGVDLNGADLTDANLLVAKLNGANLLVADLTGANLSGVNLTGTDLTGATLFGVQSGGITGTPHALPTAGPYGNVQWQLIDGYLIGPGADLAGANLTYANLTGADLTGTDLTGANLSGANLAGVSGAAKYNSATILPAGFDPVAAGWTLVS